MGIEAEDYAGGRSLVLFPGALGDAICAEPTVAWLAMSGVVVFRARGAAAEVAALFPDRPEIGPLDSLEVDRLFAPLGDGAREGEATAWLAAFDRIISFTGASSPEFCARMGRLSTARVVPFPKREGAVHVAQEMLAAASGVETSAGAVPRIELGRSTHTSARGPRLVLHPGSASREKRPARDLFTSVARRWVEAAHGEVQFLLGPGEVGERTWWQREAGPVSCPSSVRELAEAISKAHVYIGNDSGPSHLAAALGVPSIVLYTTTSPQRFGPQGDRVYEVVLGPASDRWSELVWREVRALLP